MMTDESYGKQNCIKCRQCDKKVLVLVLKDLDKTAKENQTRECVLDLVIKPNSELKTGQLVTFEENIHEIYDDGLMDPIKVVVEIPPEMIQKPTPRNHGMWFCGKSKKGIIFFCY